MLKTTTAALIVGAALALFACGEDEACTPQCVGEQIQECNTDGTLAEAADCPEGQMCVTGHDGMDYVHCMAMDTGGMDMDDNSSMDDMDGDS